MKTDEPEIICQLFRYSHSKKFVPNRKSFVVTWPLGVQGLENSELDELVSMSLEESKEQYERNKIIPRTVVTERFYDGRTRTIIYSEAKHNFINH